MLSSPVPARDGALDGALNGALDGALDGAPTPANSSSAAASAVAAVKSSAKSNKQRMNLYLPPEHQKMFDAVRSELLLVYCTPGEVRAWITYMYLCLNLDIHKFRNVFMPYSKNFIGANSLL